MMKKILLFSHEYPPAIGGAGSVAQNIYHAAKRHNHEITVLSSSWLRSSVVPNRIKKVILWLWPLIYAPHLLFSAKKYDYIICNDGASIYCAGLYLNNKTLEKVTSIIHGVEPLLTPNNRKAKIINFRKNYTNCLNKSRQVVFVSEFIRNRFSQDLEIADLSSKTVISHNGIDKSLFYPSIVKKNEEDLSIVSVSRIVKGKGYKRKLLALSQLKNENPELSIKWTIVGDGAYLEHFKKEVADSSISEDVIFLGRIDQSELPEIYSKNKIFLLLTELEESFGLVYLEAANCGCHVIGSSVGGVPEAFKYISRGSLVELSASPHNISETILQATQGKDSARTDKNSRSIDDFFAEITHE